MTKQLILCVETNARSATDDIYIKQTINRFYDNEGEKAVKLQWVHLDMKSKYKDKEKLKDIRHFIDMNKEGENVVIYFIDTDLFQIKPEDLDMNMQIERFCADNHYELVWMCRDVEEVYWGQSVSDGKKKVQEAAKFVRNHMIDSVDEKNLDVKCSFLGDSYPIKRKSNILRVMSQYLQSATQP